MAFDVGALKVLSYIQKALTLNPLNLHKASEAPIGNPIMQDIKTALILTFKDMAIMPIRSLSKLIMSSIACDRPSAKLVIKLIQ